MNKNSQLTNKVSMEIFNLKVVNSDWLRKLFKFNVSNFNLVTVSSNKCVTDFKVASSYPTSILNIEWVVSCSVNGFAVRSRNMEYFISFLDPNV